MPQRLSESLSQVLVHLEQELATQTEPVVNAEVGRGPSLTLGQIERLLEGHGYELLLLFLALPFCFPISIPGLSLPFGLVIILIGWRLAVDRPPRLP